MSAIASQFEKIVGSVGVCAWESLEPEQQIQISAALVPGTQIDCVVYPATPAELADVMTCASQNHWRVLPCGSGSKLHWGGLAEGVQVAVSTAKLNRLIDHAVGDLTVTAEAGMRFAELQATLAKVGQFLAIAPTDPNRATLGGIVATADTGALRQRYGGIRDMLIGLSFVRADGQLAKAGGRVVKNVAGYDLMKLFTGSYGTLGIIDQVTFRVYPLAIASQTVMLTGTAEAIAQATKTLFASALTPTAIELLSDSTVAQLQLGEGMGLVSRFQGIAVSVEQQASKLLEVGQALDLEGKELTVGDESNLWHRLSEFEVTAAEPAIACKIGVLPANAVATLVQVSEMSRSEMTEAIATIHASSGLGKLKLRGDITPQMLLKIRQLCESQGGFLTVLAAPVSFKQQFDVWGYSGNALEWMQKLKHQFDPQNLLSPRRFIPTSYSQ
ncbi:MAG: FAD-binding oxidoreductase [Leptolyngbyaceae cyanobacterium RM2_2_4]|nr:FAD-binding oxidoreductase [Leptolyngbyaceae cyanobacterium SL_5_14]NJO48882.1 FAD-binding oxidoreductase [Leptolyngbyaceae cyanobacterium RM2_2_4]